MLPVALNALATSLPHADFPHDARGLLGMAEAPDGPTVSGMTANGSIDTFRRIVVGCDGSPEATDAVAFAARLAAACDAGLTLASVYTYPLFPVSEAMGTAARKHQAEAFVRRERDAHAPHSLIVAEPDISVARGLRRIVRRERSDLLVLGSASDAADGTISIGPHARQLLTDAPCAVAVVPRDFSHRSADLTQIIVGYDGGDEARGALRLAAGLAGRTGAHLRIHEVVDDQLPIGFNIVKATVGPVLGWDAVIDAGTAQAARHVLAAEASVSVPVTGTTAVGDPGAELRTLSDEVDLIVLGSLRLAHRGRLGIGATGERVLHGAACPVLLVARSLETDATPTTAKDVGQPSHAGAEAASHEAPDHER